MTSEQVEAISAEFNHVRERIKALVNVAMPDVDFPVKPEAKDAIRGLFIEGVTAHVIIAGSLAKCAHHLEGIHEEMKKANSPAPLMRR